MKLKSVQWLMALLLTSIVSANAWAGSIICTAGNVTYSAGYAPLSATINLVTFTFDVVCVRDTTGSGDITYTVTANNGLNNISGTVNRAKLAAPLSFLNYDLFVGNSCSGAEFQGAGAANSFKKTFLAMASGTQTTTHTISGCIPALQLLGGAGNYLDTVALNVAVTATSPSVGTRIGNAGSVSVNIIAPVSCLISTAPGTVAFGGYTSLGAAATGSTSFATTCSSTLPYTMSLDNAFGVVAGLNYSVGLTSNNAATTGTLTLASNGTGVAQTFYVKGNMASGQAGSCASGGCVGSKTDTRTLTVTY